MDLCTKGFVIYVLNENKQEFALDLKIVIQHLDPHKFYI